MAIWYDLPTSDAVSVFKKYFDFLTIHPFCDGNGRLSRAFLASQHNTSAIFPLFLLQTKGGTHNDIIAESNSIKRDELIRSYVRTFLAYSRETHRIATMNEAKATRQITSTIDELGCTNVPEFTRLVIQEPYLSKSDLKEQYGLAASEIKKLVESGLLATCRLKGSANTIYQSIPSVSLHKLMITLIIKHPIVLDKGNLA
jgi:hypothetical protein